MGDWGETERNFRIRWTECNREETEKQDGRKEGRKGK